MSKQPSSSLFQPISPSHSTTTLLAPLIFAEVARTILRQHELTASDITSSPLKAMLLQELILEGEYSRENAAGSQWFTSDRSRFDPIVYTRKYVGDEGAKSLMRTRIWKELKERIGQSIIDHYLRG